MVRTCLKTLLSWRRRYMDSRSSHMVRRLTLCSGLNIPNESVVTAIRTFIEELLLNPINTKMIYLVLIHLMAAFGGISYLEAELLIQDSCQQKITY
ncbi:hypothetical protein ACJMK2_003587 [Sinanodonta woodiana]|uniref:Uncharacterized protein n=1 Tax=Sinanodonta woodiana TaxID=1069815 RepID=A0ABD3Y1X7_SINWO